MHPLRVLSALLLAALLPLPLFAQVVVDGRVLDADDRAPLAGVHVLAEHSTLGTVTDADGRFRLSAPARPAALVFSFLGYQTRTVDVPADGAPMTVHLEARLLDLQPVVVSASRAEERRTEAPVAVAALTARDLEAQKPDALHQALNTLPGVHMTDLGNEQHVMSIRQPMSYKAVFAYLEDGVPLRPTGVFNHNALIEVNMAGLDRVEVVRGPASSLYGSNAVGGAVNFITPRPTARPTGAARVRRDTHGYGRVDLQGSGTRGRLGVWAGGYVAQQRESWAEHSDFDKQSLTLRADYAFAPTTHLVTTLSTNHLDTDTNGSLDSLNFYSQGFTSLQTFTYRKVDATRATARLDHVWSSRQSTEVTVYGRRNRIGQLPHYRIRNDRANAAAATGEVNEDRFWSLGLNVQHRLYVPFLQGRLITGATVDRSPNSYTAHFIDVVREAATGRYQGYAKRDSLLTDYDVDLLNTAAYAQVEVSPLARLKLVGSLRYDRLAYGYDNHLPPSAFSGAPDADDVFDRVSPRLGFTVDAGAGRGVYGNVSRGFMPPEVGELYRGVKVPVLRPATFDSYEVGGWAALLGGRLYADVSVYRMDGTDEIISVRLEDGSSENRNAGRTRHVGVEYALSAAPTRALSLRLTGTVARHTFVRHEDRGQTLHGHDMDAAPGWMTNAEATYRPAGVPGLRLGLGWEHVGPYYMDPANTLRYGGYDLLNLRAGYARRGVEVWANVRNAADALYANIASKTAWGHQYNPGAPRSVSVGIGYTFDAR